MCVIVCLGRELDEKQGRKSRGRGKKKRSFFFRFKPLTPKSDFKELPWTKDNLINIVLLGISQLKTHHKCYNECAAFHWHAYKFFTRWNNWSVVTICNPKKVFTKRQTKLLCPFLYSCESISMVLRLSPEDATVKYKKRLRWRVAEKSVPKVLCQGLPPTLIQRAEWPKREHNVGLLLYSMLGQTTLGVQDQHCSQFSVLEWPPNRLLLWHGKQEGNGQIFH